MPDSLVHRFINSLTYFLGCEAFGSERSGFEFVEHGRQILTSEFPFKGLGDLLIVALKRHQLLFKLL